MFNPGRHITRFLLLLLYYQAAKAVMQEIWKERFFAVTLLYLGILEIFWLLMEAGNIRQRRILDLVYGQFFGALCANIFFAALTCTISSYSVPGIFTAFFVLTLLEAGTGMTWAAIFFYLHLKKQAYKKALFIYGNREDYRRVILENHRENGYFRIEKAVHFRTDFSAIEKLLEQYQALYLGDTPTGLRNKLLKLCVCMCRECYSIPKVSDIYIRSGKIIRLYDKVLFQYPPGGLTREQETVKRGVDIIISLALLLGAFPVMLAIGCLIKLEDGGPVFYRQERITKNGKPFHMLKFRSMKTDAEKEGPRLSYVNDQRVTRVGRYIRNLHFDELPQLFNVLKGEMSLVGPRPERKEFIQEYSRVIPEFSQRLKVKGGLTGYAQIYGKYNTGPEDKVKYDLIYIYNYSLRLDIRLLFLTVRILFQKENTQGVEEGQRSAVRKKNH